MKKVYGVFSILVVLALTFGCADDVILEDPVPLPGAYEGTYRVTIPEGVLEQPIVWRFGGAADTDSTYNMWIDTTRRSEMTTHAFCNTDGDYRIGNRISLEPRSGDTRGNPVEAELWVPIGEDDSVFVSFTNCTPDQIPYGFFQIQRNTSGWDLILKQQANDTLLKEVYLNRVGEDVVTE